MVGIDGASPQAIEKLWAKGELPHFKRIADDGIFVPLKTRYGMSPVIWSTIATGVTPAQHGITDFVVPTASGDVPVSSAVRKRPALWNMLTRAERRVAVFGWWASWPAEEVSGLVVSDRAGLGVENEIFPAERADDLARWVEQARAGGIDFVGNRHSDLHDRIVTSGAKEALAGGDYDLVLAYYRSLDITCHEFWHRFEPAAFPQGAPIGAATSSSADPVTDSYRAVDRALGELLDASPPGTRVLVVSDHGFFAYESSPLQLLLNFDRVLAAVGWLETDSEGAVATSRSRAWNFASPSYRKSKQIRLADSLRDSDPLVVLAQLEGALEPIQFEGDKPAFRLRVANPKERAKGADLVAEVVEANASATLFHRGEPIRDAIDKFGRITGTHNQSTAGIFFAIGPGFRKGAGKVKPHIHDLAPTILYALGLPVADDFAGKPLLGLFTPEFTRANSVRRIPSWGTREALAAATSERDQELVDELGALGYLQ